jgi:tetratricopeptide (TPR) repeat protein
LDAVRFRRLAAEGCAALTDGDAAQAGGRLRAALNLWRGTAYAELTDCAAIADEARRLEELRLSAYEGWAEAELRLGRYGVPIAELTDLARAHPYRENLRAHLMRALYGAGRQADALQLFRETRAMLAEQLGVEPGPQLRHLHEQMLRGDGQLVSRVTVEVSVPSVATQGSAAGVPVPRELPADVSGFTGREGALKALDEMLPADAENKTGPVIISAISGMAGVGKTALAVRWAHRVAGQFPDGQLYLNLRGNSPGSSLRPIEALTALLGALGVPPQQVPVDVTAAAARYRSRVAQRRMLILLDNAESSAQVRPLLASGPGCLVLITSRDRLTGLVALDGAQRIGLDVLSPEESVALLGQMLGSGRVAAEPAAAAELARTCANLPLALRIAAAGLVDQPHRAIAGYVAELAAGNPVVALSVEGDDDTSVRNAFDLSYRAQPESAQRIFRCLGLVPGPDLGVRAVAALAGTTESRVRRTMDRLASAHLVVQHSPGRYTTHDLLRHYAADLAITEDGPAERAAARHRLFDWYLSMSVVAAGLLYPEVLRVPVPTGFPTAMPGLTGAGPARDWLDIERHNLIAVILHTARHGPREVAWRCADALRGYHDQSRHLTDWLTTSRAALAAARADADPHAQAAAYHGLAHAHYSLGHYRRSVTYLRRTLTLASEAGWDQAEAAAASNLAIALHLQGQTTESVDYLRRALDVHERINWPIGRARATVTLATAYRDIGRLHEGVELAIRARVLYGRTAAHIGEAQADAALGELYALLGRLDEAAQLLGSAQATLRAYGSRRSEACCHVWLARVHRDAGCLGVAAEDARSALDLADELGVPELQAAARHALALVSEARGDHVGAIRLHQAALTIAHRIGVQHTEGEAQLGLATAHFCLGDHHAALQYAAKALTLAQQAGFAVIEGRALTILGRLHLHLGNASRALDHARRALTNHLRTGHRIGEADTRRLLAAILHRAGDLPAANDHHTAPPGPSMDSFD